MVVGEPGIGKTALCEQLATYTAIRGGKALVGHCYEEGSLSMPYLAFVEALRSYVLDRQPEALREELGGAATEVARIVSEIRERVQVEPRPAGSDPEEDRWRLLQAVSSFLHNAANVQPLLIVVEDLHWADKGTLDLLTHIVRNQSGARLLIIGTYRDVEVDRTHPLSSALAELRRTAGFARVGLRGLNPDEVQRMLSALSSQGASWALAEAVHRQTEGNPLFIQEVVRYLVEEGLIGGEATRGRQAADLTPSMSIPEGLRDVIGKRLSRLSPERNRLLSVAAVMGRDFALAALSRVAGMEEEALLSSLDEAVRVGVVEERAQVGDVRYRFAHAFFGQTLYEEIGAARRIRFHQQVGRSLEEHYRGRLSEHAAELAEHFSHSSDSADLARAVDYGAAAAQRAMAVYDHGEAVRLLERAIDVQEVLDPDDSVKRCDLLLALGQALIPAGQPRRAYEQVAEETFALAEALGDGQRASHSCQLALWAIRSYGAATMWGTPEAQRWITRADGCAAEGTVDRVYTDHVRATLLQMFQGRIDEAMALKWGALELARKIGDPEVLFRSAWELFNGDAGPMHGRALLPVAEEFTAKPREGVPLRTLARLLSFVGRFYLEWGERERAETLWEEAQALTARTQDPVLSLMDIFNEVMLLTVDGKLEEAVTAGERLIARGDELGSPVYARQFARAALPAQVYLGRAQEALDRVGAAAQMAGAEENPNLQALRSNLLAHLGRLPDARALMTQFLAERADTAGGAINVSALTRLLETAVMVEDREAASLLAGRAEPIASLSATANIAGISAPGRHLGAAAALLSDHEQARAYYRQALEACGKIRFRPEIALTRLQLAELLLAHYPDERAEALEHLDFAITEFREMKMRPSLERALKHKGLLRA